MSLLKPVTGNLITRNHSQLGTAYSPEPARVMAERPARTVSTRQHILIVEDSPTQAAGMAFALNKAAFTVQIAQNGLEALEILKTARRDELPDLVCFDYHL